MELLPKPALLFEILQTVADPTALIFIAIAFLLFYLAKVTKDLFHPSYNLEKELLINDNPALALSVSGYWLGIGIIISGVLLGNSDNLFPHAPPLLSEALETFVWGVIGILLLNLAAFINDKFLLSTFSNTAEIIRDRNTGVGAIQLSSYLSAALLIRPFVYTPSYGSFYLDILLTLIYFLVAQCLLYIFFKIYTKLAGYPVLEELENDNTAAGVVVALYLIAIANIISFSLYTSYNLILFLLYFVNGTIVLLICRLITDKIILSKSSLRDEIVRDKNWGAALLEGTLAVAISFILISAFSLQ